VAARSSGVYWKMVYCIFALDTVNILAGIGAGLYRSSNNGDSWMPIDTIDSYRSIAQTNNGIILTVCSPYSHPGLSRSTDLGTHWNYLTTGLWNEWTYQVMTGSGGIAYVLGRYQIARTKDNGDSWSVSDSVQSNFISIALAKDGKLIAGGSNGFYISTNAP